MRAIAAQSNEHFSLDLFHLLSDEHKVIGSIPIVNGWAQIELEVKRAPNSSQQLEFFASLASLRDALTSLGSLKTWYFLHKSPGLKLRFRIDQGECEALNCILDRLAAWRWSWLGQIRFGSFFDQTELLGGFHRDDIDALLTASANVYLDSISHSQQADRAAWAIFTVGFLSTFISDRWIVWETLGRFLRLRGSALAADVTVQDVFADPHPILARIRDFQIIQPGFEASVSLLQCLNYIFNMWAIDAASQSAILEQARNLVRPEIAIP